MVPTKGDVGADGERALYRKVEGRDGAVPVEAAFRPRFDYGRAKTAIAAEYGTVVATAGETDDRVTLSSSLDFEVEGAEASATASLGPADAYWFVARYDPKAGAS